MSAPRPALPALTFVRRLRASPRKVFDMFVEPAEIMHWWGPDAGPTLSAEVDLRVGGRFRVVFQNKNRLARHGHVAFLRALLGDNA